MNIKNITRNFRTLTLGLCLGFVFTINTVYGADEMSAPMLDPVMAAGGPIGPPATKLKKLTLIKIPTGVAPFPVTYSFNVTCSGGASPYTGPFSVILTPPTPTTIGVPYGSSCSLTETQPGGTWANPVFMGSGVVVNTSGWVGNVGPVIANSSVTVTNRKLSENPEPCHLLVNVKPAACGGTCTNPKQKCQFTATGICGCK